MLQPGPGTPLVIGNQGWRDIAQDLQAVNGIRQVPRQEVYRSIAGLKHGVIDCMPPRKHTTRIERE